MSSVPYRPACPKFRREQKLLEHAAHGRDDQTCAKPNRSDTSIHRRLGCRLPCLAHIGKEIAAWRGRFGQRFITSISIETDCRTAQKRLWRLVQACQQGGEVVRRHRATRLDEGFAGLAPPLVTDACTSKVNHGVESIEVTAHHFAGLVVPNHHVVSFCVGRELGRWPHQARDAVPCCGQKRTKLQADQAG